MTNKVLEIFLGDIKQFITAFSSPFIGDLSKEALAQKATCCKCSAKITFTEQVITGLKLTRFDVIYFDLV